MARATPRSNATVAPGTEPADHGRRVGAVRRRYLRWRTIVMFSKTSPSRVFMYPV